MRVSFFLGYGAASLWYRDIAMRGGVKTSEIAGKKEPRQRVLTDAEIKALWQAVKGLGYPAAPGLCIYCS
jgi:hypothetical protein